MKKEFVPIIMVAVLFFLVGATFTSALQVNLTVLREYKEVQAGDELKFEVLLKDIGSAQRRDVTLEYYVRKGDRIIAHAKEVKAVATQTSFVGAIDIPENTPSGMYYIEIVVDGKESSMDSFHVIISKLAQIEIYLIMILVSVVTVGAVLWWELHKFMKRMARRRR